MCTANINTGRPIQAIIERANTKKHTNTDNYTHVTVQTKENTHRTKDERRLSLRRFISPSKAQSIGSQARGDDAKEKESRKEGNRKVGMESNLNPLPPECGRRAGTGEWSIACVCVCVPLWSPWFKS